MNKIFTSIFCAATLLFINPISAQVRNVTYDFQRNTFDNDYDLPSDQRFNISGFIDTSVQLVEVDIYQGINKKEEINEYYSTYWLRDKSDNSTQFYLSIKKALRANESYDFNLRLYRSLDSAEVAYTKESLVTSIQNYLLSGARATNKEMVLEYEPGVIQTEMNRIVQQGLVKYRTRTLENFPGFSDIIKRQLEDFSDITGSRAKAIRKDEDNNMDDEFVNKMAGILSQVSLEIEQFLNNEMLVLSETKVITGHPSEKQRHVVAINGGYGGAWFSGNLNNFNYGHAPYVGLSFPLGKKAHSKKFWTNASISTGVFVLNFKDADDNEIKGPIIQRPFYVGLGYKFFRFLRVNAGAVLLEKKSDNGEFINTDKIFVRPFVGLSIEINFWADFAK